MIQLTHVSKMYRSYARRSDRLREWVSFNRKKLHREIWALKDISLTVPEGTVYGMVGLNGAGKSTLLKILAGTTKPTTGEIMTSGRIAALLELGTGFHGELTGRENIMINGSLLGMGEEELLARMESIREFAELGDFFDSPVRTYSSGMYVRLAFALAASVDPKILIIDEALSVGDAYFQQKCLKRIRQFKDAGTTILLVSHDLGAVKTLCDHAALLDRGKILEEGEVGDILELYNALIARQGPRPELLGIKRSSAEVGTRSGNRKAEITSVEIKQQSGAQVTALQTGKRYSVLVHVHFRSAIDNPTVGILIRDRLGYDIFGTNTSELGIQTGSFKAGSIGTFLFDCQFNLGRGQYTITAAAHSDRTHVDDCYDWIDRVLMFEVVPHHDQRFLGVTYMDPIVSIEQQAQ